MRDPLELAPLIDHTVLRPDATANDVERACTEAREYGFAGVCVRLQHVALVSRLLAGSASRAISVVAFPTGTGGTAAKLSETRAALAAGAEEIDMVIDLEAVKRRDHRVVLQDIAAVVDCARPRAVKAILETGALTHEEKAIAAALAAAAGAAFVKTSTGFGSGGATAEDVALLRSTVGTHVGVKASGGIRTAADAWTMVDAGANRLGTSAGVAIVAAKSPNVRSY
ncbi:MAG TPA: deoxyribose-phosphate aldolase [Myxococcales bacterium]|nr:deoxyribose-phosphate aldolase [Myxococcales bacterium]